MSSAGGLEVFWSTCLKFSEGFTVLKFTILTVIGMIFSFVFLSQATKVLPLGTSYAIWTGIGALGAVIVESCCLKNPFPRSGSSSWLFCSSASLGSKPLQQLNRNKTDFCNKLFQIIYLVFRHLSPIMLAETILNVIFINIMKGDLTI